MATMQTTIKPWTTGATLKATANRTPDGRVWAAVNVQDADGDWIAHTANDLETIAAALRTLEHEQSTISVEMSRQTARDLWNAVMGERNGIADLSDADAERLRFALEAAIG